MASEQVHRLTPDEAARRQARRDRGRQAGVLRVNAIHEDTPFPATVAGEVDAEIDALAAWLGLERDRGVG
jgi:uncharacterized protein YcaQ